MSICFLNDKYLEIQDAKISPLDRGFLFGDAVYEVIIALNRKPFELDAHIERLKKNRILFYQNKKDTTQATNTYLCHDLFVLLDVRFQLRLVAV